MEMNKTNNIKSSFYLSLTAIIWGVAFVFQSMGNNYMEPFTFNSARNFLGFLVLIPIVLIKLRKPEIFSGSNESFKIDKKITVIGGVCCGLALAAAGMFQQYGVKYTTVGKAGFITTLYIILTPIFGLLLGKKCHFTVWIGAVGAVVGLYMLCITESLSFSPGDILVLICAVVCGAIALIIEHPSWEQLTQGAIPILYTGIMSSGVAYTLQVIGQKNFNPTIAAMIMSLESVISALASYFAYSMGWLEQDQSMTVIQILGCVIMFCSVIFVQLPFDKLHKH